MTEHVSSPDHRFALSLTEALVKPEPIAGPPELQLRRVGALSDVSLDDAVIDPTPPEAVTPPERLTKTKIESLRSTLDRIRSEEEPLSNEFARELLDVARLANLEAIAEQPDSGTAMEMLKRVAPLMRGPVSFDELEDGISGTTKHSDNSVIISPHEVFGPDPRRFMEKKGFTFKHPTDPALFRLIRVGAHEDGHVMGSGISMMIAEREFLAVTKNHLIQHPEQAVTGNLAADIRIQEERLAEGIGIMGQVKIMEVLGYSKDQIDIYIKQSIHTYNVWGKKHHNQLDHLSKTDHKAGAHELVPPTAPKKQRTAETLGYTKPFSANEVMEVLEAAVTKLETATFGIIAPDPAEWYQTVHATEKESSLKTYLQMLQEKRKRARRVESFLGGATMMFAMLGGATGLSADKPVPPPVPKEMSVYGTTNPDIANLLKDGYVLREKMIDLDNPEQPEGKFTLTGQKDEYGRPIADVHLYYSTKTNKENNSR